MTRVLPRLTVLILLMLYGVGLPQFAHNAMEHRGPAVSATVCGHGHDHGEAPADRTPADSDNCPTCQLLAGSVAIVWPAPTVIGLAPALAAPADAPREAPACEALVWTLGPRGPPALRAA